MNIFALFHRPAVKERIVYSRSTKAAAEHLARRRAMHAKLIDETIQDEAARIEMQRTLFGLPAVREGLGV
jgi:hypothetical protein